MSSMGAGGPQNRADLPRWLVPAGVIGLIVVVGGFLVMRLLNRDQDAVDPTATVVVVAVATAGDPTAVTQIVAVVASPTRAIPDCTEPFMPVYDLQVVNVEQIAAQPASTRDAVDSLGAVAPAGELLAHLPLDDGPNSDETGILSKYDLQTQLRGEFEWRAGGAPVADDYALAFVEDGAALEISNPADNGYLRQSSPGRLVAMWIRPEDISQSQVLYSEGDETNGLRISIADGRLVSRVAGTLDGSTVENEASIPLDFNTGEWHHVAVDYNYDALSLYLDGELLATVRGSPIAITGAEGNTAQIGGIFEGEGDVINNPYRGQMADIRIYGSPALLSLTTPQATETSQSPTQATSTPTSITPTPPPVSTATGTATPEIVATEPPQQQPTPTAETAASGAITIPTIVGIPPSVGIRNIPLFELPFPYDGGNSRFGGTADQFFKAIQGVYNGGRVTSYYDHQYPLYPPNFNGLEPVDYDGKMVTWAGVILDTVYSGHPGFDMSPNELNRSTTPLFAAADGVIRAATIHEASGGYYVEILHRLTGVGDFLSRYWHLEPDDYFEETRNMVGEFVPAGTRIGTIGNTGWSTGHHLHFEVRYDQNGDGQFGRNETIDPFGFITLSPFAPDPWQAGISIVRNERTNFIAGPASSYLWKFPLGTTARMPEAGGGKVAVQTLAVGGEGGPSLCMPEESVPPGATVNFSLIPDPPPSRTLAGTGNGCVLSGFTGSGEPITAFDPPVEVYMPFDPGDLVNIERPEETLAVYWLNPDTGKYEPRPTVIDFNLGLAYATLDRPGHCSLLGLPNRDLVAPVTTIQVDGPLVDNAYSGQVTVSLTAVDDQSEIGMTSYSLDNGSTWHQFEGEFSIPANELLVWPPSSEGLSDELEEGMPKGPGRYLVLAASQDSAGNLEIPPAFRIIVIDPRLQSTATVTMPPSPTATTPAPSVANCTHPAGWVPYRIQNGDTLSRLSALTNTTMPRLLDGNCRLPGDVIVSVGELFFLPQILGTATAIALDGTPDVTLTVTGTPIPGPPLTGAPTPTGTGPATTPTRTPVVPPTDTPVPPTPTTSPTPYIPPPTCTPDSLTPQPPGRC